MKLTGLKVVDLSVFLPGPYMTSILADHGADVVKIEMRGEGDPARGIGPRFGVASVLFHNVNRGKTSVALDLKTAEDKARLLELVGAADVFVEAFRPGVMKRLGFDYDRLAAINPRLVYCSISAFGQSGPYRDRPAHDLAIQAMSGAQSLTEGADGNPAMCGVAMADIISGLHALSGVLIAVMRARETGRGDFLDVSMHESLLASVPNVLGPVFVDDAQPKLKEARTTGGAAFYQIYRTRDGRHVVLGGQELKFATNLLTALGRADLIPLCRLPPGPGQAPVIQLLRETFATRTMAEWEQELGTSDICFAPVKTLPEAFADPHALAREAVLRDADGRRHVAPVVRFRNEPAQPDLRVPALGEYEGW